MHSPNIDRLAHEGVLFSSSFCVAPQCSPSRAAMFTGRYPHSNGVLGLTHERFAWELNRDELHLAQLLQDAGYRTASLGVVHETQRNPSDWGYELRYEARESAATATRICDETIELLRRFTNHRDTPFFICAGAYEPHRLFATDESDYMGFVGNEIEPDSDRGVYVPPYLRTDPGTITELAELQGAIRYLDRQFGRVLQAIDQLGLRDNTLVVFTTDHGIAMPRAKCSCYDPGLEIAFILRLPSRNGWHGGRTVHELVPNIDLAPSLCELIGAEVPETVQGRSWVPLLDGADSYEPNRVFFPELTYHDYYDPIRGIRTTDHKLLAFFSAAHSFMPPNQSWKRRSSPRQPERPPLSYHPEFELYHLLTDPWEQVNLIDDMSCADVKRTLMQRLWQHLVATDDPIIHGAITSPMHQSVVRMLGEA